MSDPANHSAASFQQRADWSVSQSSTKLRLGCLRHVRKEALSIRKAEYRSLERGDHSEGFIFAPILSLGRSGWLSPGEAHVHMTVVNSSPDTASLYKVEDFLSPGIYFSLVTISALIMHSLYAILSLSLVALPQHAQAQDGPCPLLGAIFPPAQHPLESNTFSDTIANLTSTFEELERNGTFEEFNTTLYVQAFSASDTLFQHGYVPPAMKGFLTSGTLNEDTVFRIGSVSKLFTVYTLLAEVGMKRMNDPVTKWVPELARAAKKNKGDPVRKVQWDEVTIGQLSGHLAGVSRNCKYCCGPCALTAVLTLVCIVGLFDMQSLFDSSDVSPEKFGLPILDKKKKTSCSISDAALGPCSRKGTPLDPPSLRYIANICLQSSFRALRLKSPSPSRLLQTPPCTPTSHTKSSPIRLRV